MDWLTVTLIKGQYIWKGPHMNIKDSSRIFKYRKAEKYIWRSTVHKGPKVLLANFMYFFCKYIKAHLQMGIRITDSRVSIGKCINIQTNKETNINE